MDEFQPYIIVNDALERVRGNRTVYKSLLSVFLKDDRCSALKEQLDAGDLTSAARTAHALKGIAANLSLKALYEAVLMMELRLKNGESAQDGLTHLEDTRARTRRCAERLMSAL